jgi:hypothetical protein
VTKEIGYAQYVLRHKNITTSQTYTTLIVNMAMGDRLRPAKVEANRIVVEATKVMGDIDDMRQMVIDVKRELDEARAEIQSNRVEKKRMSRKLTLDFVVGDTVVEFDKLRRAPNGSSRLWLVARALRQAKRMEEVGIPLTRTNMTKVGVNTNIVVEVMEVVSGW